MTEEHPEDWSRRISRDDVREALAEIDAKANEQYGDYAAGMRNARLVFEEALLTDD
jgi:hypothetical protein